MKHKLHEYLSYYSTLNISNLSYYEILSGLKYKDAHKYLDSFLKLCELATIIPITEEPCIKAADIYADLRRNGKMINDVDILIAGICLENNFILVTNNWKPSCTGKGHHPSLRTPGDFCPLDSPIPDLQLRGTHGSPDSRAEGIRACQFLRLRQVPP
ncbi:MAG: PIN domain-containing protein [Acidobacteria bacterium]|nr:PIN domain-containing protein [Acidobacteriota bacterium]